MITIHNFLGRPLTCASGQYFDEDENVKEKDSTSTPIQYKIEDMTPADVHFGRLPQSVVNDGMEHLHRLVENDADLFAIRKVARNGHSLYSKTRPDATRKGIKLGKKVGVPEIHPLFIESTSQGEHNLDDYLSTLRSFRPSQTVFEVEQAKRGNAKKAAELTSMMKEKRKMHTKAVVMTEEELQIRRTCR